MVRTLSGEDESIPSQGDPDRKRVLNVLAQRRYRQRRRQRMADLESRAKGTTASSDSTSSHDGTSPNEQESVSPPSHGGVPVAQEVTVTTDPYITLPTDTLDNAIEQAPDEFVDMTIMNQPLSWTDTATDALFDDTQPTQMAPSLSTAGLRSGSDPFSITTALAPSLSNMPNPEEPLMKVISVSLHIASLLGCSASLWDESFRWTLDPLACAALPPAFQPTAVQFSIPHHPLFDIIPFPATRTKLICIFAMPETVRPPHAKGEHALMDLVHDLEDATEGMRASRGDGYREEDWEVGEAFARHWWWALDRETVRRSNEMRLLRGARRLLDSPG